MKQNSLEKAREEILKKKKEIQELKKQKLLEILNSIPKEWKIKEGSPIKETSTYRSVYRRYLIWKNRHPNELPNFKEIWLTDTEQKHKKKAKKGLEFVSN